MKALPPQTFLQADAPFRHSACSLPVLQIPLDLPSLFVYRTSHWTRKEGIMKKHPFSFDLIHGIQ
jgi:hypothetical protein